jgi:hypothetical protein
MLLLLSLTNATQLLLQGVTHPRAAATTAATTTAHYCCICCCCNSATAAAVTTATAAAAATAATAAATAAPLVSAVAWAAMLIRPHPCISVQPPLQPRTCACSSTSTPASTGLCSPLQWSQLTPAVLAVPHVARQLCAKAVQPLCYVQLSCKASCLQHALSTALSHTPMSALCKCLSTARLLPPATSGMLSAVSV